MFSYRLSRLPFALLMYLHQFWAISMMNSSDERHWILLLLSMPAVLIFVILPRVRDCDWPIWIGFTTMVPYLGMFTGTTLLFARPKVLYRSDEVLESDQDE